MSTQNERLKKAFNIDAKELTPAQIRLLNTLGPLIAHLISTDEEDEFFEASKELLQLCATLIKESNFPISKKDIPYGEQGLEYALDQLGDHPHSDHPRKWDN